MTRRNALIPIVALTAALVYLATGSARDGTRATASRTEPGAHSPVSAPLSRQAYSPLAGRWARSEAVLLTLGYPKQGAQFAALEIEFLEQFPATTPGDRERAAEVRALRKDVNDLDHNLIAQGLLSFPKDEPARRPFVMTHRDGRIGLWYRAPSVDTLHVPISFVPGNVRANDLLVLHWPGGRVSAPSTWAFQRAAEER